jgi:exosome complex exonuclease RRP6
MSDDADFQSIHDSITSALVLMTRATNQVCAEDVTFYRSLDRSIASTLDQQQATLLSLAERLLRNATAGTDTESPRLLADVESLDQAWKGVVDVLDGLLERADMCLDEFAGLVRKGERDGGQTVQVWGDCDGVIWGYTNIFGAECWCYIHSGYY